MRFGPSRVPKRPPHGASLGGPSLETAPPPLALLLLLFAKDTLKVSTRITKQEIVVMKRLLIAHHDLDVGFATKRAWLLSDGGCGRSFLRLRIEKVSPPGLQRLVAVTVVVLLLIRNVFLFGGAVQVRSRPVATVTGRPSTLVRSPWFDAQSERRLALHLISQPMIVS